MRDGFVKVAAVTPDIRVADTKYNGEQIRSWMKKAAEEGAKVIVFPELCITGYTCGDLFLQDTLLCAAKEELLRIESESRRYDAIFFVGLPYEINGKLYNLAAAVSRGHVLGLVPKTFIPNYNEFYELRHFTPGGDLCTEVALKQGEAVPVDTDLLFACEELANLRIGVEICEDLWTPVPPSTRHAMAGATVIANLSASDEITGKAAYRRSLVNGQSARLICGYIYASAGEGESTQDVVYSGHDLIAENGYVLAENRSFKSGAVYTELDVDRLSADRRRMSTFEIEDTHTYITFHLQIQKTTLSRYVDPFPFVPGDADDRAARCEEILGIQAAGLKKRLEHTGSACAVIGISGGLDSTLALLVTLKAFAMLGKDPAGILAVTMPGFGTTDRTYGNATTLVQALGATLMEVNIAEAVRLHFRDIGQDETVHDVTYENCQARERTQILMDLANQKGGMVIGTGDLSELALGWATYNGDHMSMYAVNASVPKTLVRHLVAYYADTCGNEPLKKVLYDILDTPVSPELLPPHNGTISQRTEDIVGPYELHDFFLYGMQRMCCSPAKVFRLACIAFGDTYVPSFILKWEKVFYRRYFAQQFKRSCLPDGPKVGSVAVSPRGDLRMPSDACVRIWMEELEQLEVKGECR